jgi:adenine deaminase
MRLGRPVEPGLFAIPAAGRRARVIGVVPGQIVTRALEADMPARGGLAQAAPERDLAKLAVVERHAATGNVGLGFVQGLGLARGAVASSVAHDSHNIVARAWTTRTWPWPCGPWPTPGAGWPPRWTAVLALLPLPVAGLMADRPRRGCGRKDALTGRARAAAPRPRADPFMTLSFLALPVIRP